MQAQLEAWVRQLPIEVTSLVVTGSRARNTHFSDSDIDVIVVSPAFAGMRRPDRIDLLLQPWYDRPALEPFGLCPDELDCDSLYLWDALCDGRALQDDGTWQAARDRHLVRLEAGELVRQPGGWRQRC